LAAAHDEAIDQSVSNIYKYYIAYSLVQDDVARELKDAARGPGKID
jgi:hypothetical protein